MSGTGDYLVGVLHNLDKYSIGDRVKLLEDKDSRIYTIYSITQYKTHTAYTLWNGEDYMAMEEWQIRPYNGEVPIGFNSNLGQPTV